jgi:hypothetical protein
MSVDTKRVSGRRALRYSTFQQMLDDVHLLAARPNRQLGNWTLGQICQHLAVAMDSAIDGPPFKPSWVVRLVGPLLKKRVLTRGLDPGFQLPKRPTKLRPAEVSTADGVAALNRAVERQQRDSARQPHIVFGKFTNDEWTQFLLRHAELHLSFILPE